MDSNVSRMDLLMIAAGSESPDSWTEIDHRVCEVAFRLDAAETRYADLLGTIERFTGQARQRMHDAKTTGLPVAHLPSPPHQAFSDAAAVGAQIDELRVQLLMLSQIRKLAR